MRTKKFLQSSAGTRQMHYKRPTIYGQRCANSPLTRKSSRLVKRVSITTGCRARKVEQPKMTPATSKGRRNSFSNNLIAAEFGLNCIIHQRGETLNDTLALMQPFVGKTRGVFHCFSSDLDALQRIRATGSIVSFTGIVTFKNGQNVRDAVAATPLGEFMLETDCPFLAPIPYRGKRCEPAHVKEIAETCAQVKGCSLEELSRATCDTAHEFFPKLR